MRLSDYLREDLVLHGLRAEDSQSALKAFGACFESGGYVGSSQEPYEALRAREEAHTTCLGRGVAVPHATVTSLEDPLLLVAAAAEPVPYGPPESGPVSLFFVLLSPPGREGTHIKLLARICRLAQHPEDLAALTESTDAASLLEAVLRIDSRHV